MVIPLEKPIDTPKLVGIEACIAEVFPDQDSRPGLRTFREWQARGFIPFRKINQRVFYDPREVRHAIDRKFKVHARS